MRSGNRLLEVLGRDGALRLHLPSTDHPVHYSVASRTLISLSEMRNVISGRNKTTWANTGTWAGPRPFYEPTQNQKSISERWEALKRLMISRNA